MHILIIPSDPYLPPDIPLSGIFQRDQALALAKSGHQVGILSVETRTIYNCLFGNKRLLSDSIFGQIEDGIYVSKFECTTLYPWASAAYARQWVASAKVNFMEYVAAQGYPDVIHAHNAVYGGVAAEALSKIHHIPYVITEHSSAYARGLLSKSQLRMAQAAFNGACARLAVSQALIRDLSRAIGQDPGCFEFLPNLINGIFEEDLPQLQDKSTAQGVFRFLTIARLVREKGLYDLIRSFAKSFSNQDQSVQLRIGGIGPERTALEALVRECGIEKQVVFLGALTREDVRNEMLAAGVFVLTSHYETFSVVLIEALSCGRPVIATSCGGPESIVNSQNGMLVPVKDVSAIAAAMKSLFKNNHQYDPLAIRSDCLQRFGQERVVVRLCSIYKGNVITKSGGRHE